MGARGGGSAQRFKGAEAAGAAARPGSDGGRGGGGVSGDMYGGRGCIWLVLAAALLHGNRGAAPAALTRRGLPGAGAGGWANGQAGGWSRAPAGAGWGGGRALRPAGLSASQVSLQGEFQRRLYKELVKNYNPLERPVANDSQPLTVYFSLSLLQIMDVVSVARRAGRTPFGPRRGGVPGRTPPPPATCAWALLSARNSGLKCPELGVSSRNRLRWSLSVFLREKTSVVLRPV